MDLSAPSTLLLRNRAHLAGQRLLVVDPADDDIVPCLANEQPGSVIASMHTQYDGYLRARRRCDDHPRIAVHFGPPANLAESAADLAIVYPAKGRAHHDMLITLVASTLPDAGRLLWVGETRLGVAASARLLSDRFARTEKLDAARRCALYLAETPEPISDGRGGLNAWFHTDACATPQGLVPIASLPGVFSHGRLDDGTRLLLETLPDVVPARVLDIGCGCGIIGVCCRKTWPDADVALVDASFWAIAAAQRTAQLNGLPPDCVYPSDVFSHVAADYDLIVSNPPFHAGLSVDYAVVRRLIADARDHLRPGGRLRLVVNRHLPYRTWLADAFGTCTIVAETNRYRVWDAVVPGRRG